MRRTLRKLIVTGTTLAGGCLVLVGCGGSPSGDEPPTDAEAKTVDGPTALLSAGCDDLIELSLVQGALGEVTAGVDPVRVPGGSWAPEHIGLAQSGALDCYWSDDAAPIIRALVDAVTHAEAGEPAWQPTGTLPAACAEWLTTAQISSAVGTDGIAEREFPLSMPIILNGALADGLACSWSNSYSSDQAFAGCATDQDACFVDVLAGGAWFAVDGNEQAGIEGLQRVAAAAVAGLSP